MWPLTRRLGSGSWHELRGNKYVLSMYVMLDVILLR
jgi:hypothetical protein